jgi:hypothetical protein
MQLRYRTLARVTLLFGFVGFGVEQSAYPAFADSVPESIRIQQQAEKAYETAPVKPIERQNAHHRDQSKDAPATDDGRGLEDQGDQVIVPYYRRPDR